LECIKKYYRIDRKEISFLKFIFEAYDGIAVISTIDAPAGRVVIAIPPGCLETADMVLGELAKELLI